MSKTNQLSLKDMDLLKVYGTELSSISSKSQWNSIIHVIQLLMKAGEKSETKAADNSVPSAIQANIATLIRVRPLLPSQQSLNQAIFVKDNSTLEIEVAQGKRVQKVSGLFGAQTTQREVFQAVRSFLGKVTEGYNVTVFTYGQTGSGKTYTMFGSDWNNIIKNGQGKAQQATFLRSIQQDQNHSGLIPRTIHHLFSTLPRPKYTKIFVSFLQLYNQSLHDLLSEASTPPQLLIHQNKTDGIYIENLTEIHVESADECLEWMRKGQRNRVVRQTRMNVKSSRSHTIFMLLLQEVFPSKKSYRRMKINLCDLAGSQKLGKGQIKIGSQHFEQMKKINLSLTTLGKVISSLAGNQPNGHPPFRDSKLTRLLQDSLGGSTPTLLLGTLTSISTSVDESLNTLKFLERASQVKSYIQAKIFSDNPELRTLQKQIKYLKDMMRMGVGRGVGDREGELTEKVKKLQSENQKLKQIVELQVVEKLKRENISLKLQLERKSNDNLSDSYIKSKNAFKTLDYGILNKQDADDNKSEKPPSFFSSKASNSKRYDIKTLTQNSHGTKQTIYNRKSDNGILLFPSLPKKDRKITTNSTTNKILERIQQIEKAKQRNRQRLQRNLQGVGGKNHTKYSLGYGKQ